MPLFVIKYVLPATAANVVEVGKFVFQMTSEAQVLGALPWFEL
jgi:hypothetical protein